MQNSHSVASFRNDTIAALCTAPGGALAIIRISGPGALRAASAVWHGGRSLSEENDRVMHLGRVRTQPEDDCGEPCLAVYMKGPRSYTGEDVVELHCHGGAFAPKRLLAAVFASGVRPAEPGEFTRRAFLNGKMDLTQAEAVADLIHAKSESAARLAERQMSGLIGGKVRAEREKLLHVLAEIESRLDFPEEDLDWLPASALHGAVKDSILFRQVQIAAGAQVENCVIMNDAVIGEGCVLKNVILDKDVVVRPGATLIGSPTTPVIIKRGEIV